MSSPVPMPGRVGAGAVTVGLGLGFTPFFSFFSETLRLRSSLGWKGTDIQWRHYTKAYLYLAGLATPLVLSVHRVVSWDFAMGIVPGWHTTIFAPYFVAGAIYSGVGMVVTLLVPLRTVFKLERYIHEEHFDNLGKVMLLTGSIVSGGGVPSG